MKKQNLGENKSKITLKKIKKQVKGITLIALVVTIIVLLILAAVAINLTIGNNGIFTRAQNATQKWEEASKNEQDEIDKVSNFLDDYMNGNAGSQGEDDKVTWLDDVPVPDGFYYAGGSKDNGLVISDNVADKKDYTEENKNADVSTDLQGNQFVWVPVPDPSKIFVDETVKLNGVETTTDVYSKLTIRDEDKEYYTASKPGETSKVREPDVLSSYDTDEQYYKTILGFNSTKEMADSMAKEYKAMSDSVKKYKGFYIGRYEITGTVDSPTEKKGAVLSADKAGNWYSLYKACKGFTKGNVVSTMIYGCQWDATMEWLKQTEFKEDPSKVDTDSSSWGNYNSSKIETGSNPAYQANKIFDLAGNYLDWTQEASHTYSRVNRRWWQQLFKL